MKKVLITAIFPFPALAYQPDSINISSGYGIETDVKEITSPVDLITEKEIQEKNPFDIRELIFNRNGFAYSSNGGFGQTTSLYLWGTDPKRTVVFIDGIRVNDFTTPNISPAYELLLMDDIKQVEIIKGVQSGVWGADAVGGVINIVSAEPQEGTHIKLKGMLGDYNTKKAGFTLSYRNEKIGFLLGYHWLKTSGFSAAEPVKSSPDYGKRWNQLGWERDPYRNDTLNFKTNWYITEKDIFEAVVKTIDAVIHYDAAAGVDARDYDDPFGFGISEYFNHYSQQFYKLQYSRKTDKNHFIIYYTNSIFKRTQYGGYEGRYREYTLKNRYTHSFGFIKAGFSRCDYIHTKSGGITINSFYHNNSYYLTNLLRAGNSILSQSIRHDSYSAFKDKTTWKIGVKHFLKKELYIGGNWGTGYNVPTLDQLFNPWWGNSQLKPENAVQWDVNAGFKDFSVAYFRYSIKNLINYSFSTYRYENIPGKTKIEGVDASYSRYFSPVKTFVRLNYTYLFSKKSDGGQLPRRPYNQVGFDLVWYPAENSDIGISGVYVGKRKDSSGAQTGYYTVINGYANLGITRNIKLSIKMNNITDKYYQTVDGYATAGRSIYFGTEVVW
ncbi:TonB-dependent receptor plug domain-containing protein [Persephonella sp.]